MNAIGPRIVQALTVCLTLLAVPATAQTYPTREIHILSGFAAGASGDLFARQIGEKIRPMAGKPVIVENKPGALTAIAAEALKRAAPDGQTIMITAGNATMAANPYLIKDIKYDPVKDFTPIATLMKSAFIVVVAENSPIKSMTELTAYLKQKGDKATYGYSNSFAVAATELYQKIAGTKAVRVSYKSTPDLMPDLQSGQLDFAFADSNFVLAQAAQGRLRPLAVTSLERTTITPELPSLNETGIKDYDLIAWWGVWAPANTPKPIADKLTEWIMKIVASDEMQPEFRKGGTEALLGDGKFLANLTVKELERWKEAVKVAGLEPQ